jgi:phage terminase small subunit
MAEKLTEKQRRFVEAYMGEAAGNATEAAKLAGYKGNNATLRAIASENLTKPNIASAVAERVESDPRVWGREQLQRFWTEVAEGKYQDEKLDRLRGSELLAKSQAMFVQKVEIKATHEEWVEDIEGD